jgi:hypothetical protein
MLELARDYTASADPERAIPIAREALTLRAHLGHRLLAQLQLTLADALLSQRHRTHAAITEAATLAEVAAGSGTSLADSDLEIEALRLLAQSHSARADFGTARAEYERAINLIFKYRSTINSPELQASTAADDCRTLFLTPASAARPTFSDSASSSTSAIIMSTSLSRFRRELVRFMRRSSLRA